MTDDESVLKAVVDSGDSEAAVLVPMSDSRLNAGFERGHASGEQHEITWHANGSMGGEVIKKM